MILLIDSHYIGYQALYTLGGSEGLSHRDLRTGVMFGFLSRILSLGQFFHTNNLIFCWDSKTSKRKQLFAEYKRHKTDRSIEEKKRIQIACQQFTLLRREVLPAMGFTNCFIQKGFEADDLIAKIAQTTLLNKIIVSADEDYYQCLSPSLRIWNPSRKKMMTKSMFLDAYKIQPKQWAMVKQIAGCNSDQVPGVRGVGEVFAVRFIRKTLPPHTQAYKSIMANQAIIKRNAVLVTLPFPGTKPLQIVPTTFKRKGFKRVCEQYGFHSFLQPERYNAWKELMSGGLNT